VTSTFLTSNAYIAILSAMPRTARAAVGGLVYHVLNRGNGRMEIFRKPEDYLAFARLMIDAKKRADVEIFGFCLMPNHWHLVLRPRRDHDLATYFSWLTNTHVKRYRSHYHGSTGHLYQGRYKSFPVEEDHYFLTLMRYVEANPLRAELVARAQEWPWSSLGCSGKVLDELLTRWPVDRPPRWTALVNEPLQSSEIKRLQLSLSRTRPLGSDSWTMRIAGRLGLEFTINPRGRPKLQEEKA
jgi:putative transposase